MNPTEPFLEEFAMDAFGRSRAVCQATSTCVQCGQPAIEFTDEISRREYHISKLCQVCQNKVFGFGTEEEY